MMPPRRRVATEPGRAITPCAVGETLCTVRVLSEAEYAALPPGRRPAEADHVPGLGWVVATLGDRR